MLTRPPIANWLVPLVVVAAIAVGLGIDRFRNGGAGWSPDGAIYLRMTLVDRGASFEEARRVANVYVLGTGSNWTAGDRAVYSDDPPPFYRDQVPLFRTRPLYPALGALLYPRYGPDGLKIISVVAYVAAVVLSYLLLLQLAAPWFAVLGAVTLATTPAALYVANVAGSDALDFALWIAALGALVAYVRTRSFAWLAGLIFAAAALAFVRPAVYLPLGAALGAFVAAPRGSRQRVAAGRAAIAVGAVALAFVAYTALVHGPGVVEQLRWQYAFVRDVGPHAEHGFFSWWIYAIASALARLLLSVFTASMFFVVVVAGFGVALARRTWIMPILLGGAAATLVAVLVNPLEQQRTVMLPLTPVLVVLVTIALVELAQRIRPPQTPVRDS